MKTYTPIELTEVLRLHKLYLNNDPAGVRADLYGAYLSEADLRGANLYGAYLSGANLQGADLFGVTGNMLEIRSIQIDTWAIAYTADRMQIGCQNASIDEWRARTPDDVAGMAYAAREWWEKWKTFILTAIDLAPATPTGHEGK